AAAAALEVLSKATKVGALAPLFSSGWHETGDRAKGRFESRWGVPESWKGVILQGPYFHVGNPFASERNETMASNRDYSALDLETLTESAIPATEYKPLYGEKKNSDGQVVADTSVYDAAYGTWRYQVDRGGKTVTEKTPIRDHYRLAWRAMAATTGERTLISAIFPPGFGHVNAVQSMGLPGAPLAGLALSAASSSSLISDFLIRSSVTGTTYPASFSRMPNIPRGHVLS